MSRLLSTERADETDSGEGSIPITVGETSEIPDNGRGFFTIGDVNVTIFDVDGELYAVENSCPHLGGPLGEGKLLRTEAGSTNLVSRFRDFDPRLTGVSRAPTASPDATARLTISCPHHGWEFDLADGTPVFPAKRGVRTYAVWAEDGLIKLDLTAEANRTRRPR